MTEFTETVLDLIAQIPPGRITTYGTISAAAKMLCGVGSARSVGAVLSQHGDKVPWWRVVNAKGECAPHLVERQYRLLTDEGVPFSRSIPPKALAPDGFWQPPLESRR